MDRMQAAAATLEAMRWTFDGKIWQPPTDRNGNSLFVVINDMVAILQHRFDQMIDRAHYDVGAEFVVSQIGSLLYSWDQVKPSALDADADA